MKYTYTGEDERVFPTLGIIVNKGDTFEAEDGLDLANATSSKKAAPAVIPPTEPIVGE